MSGGKLTIDLTQEGCKEPWCNIEVESVSNDISVLLGMYEFGIVTRTLFLMDKAKLKQLHSVIGMLITKDNGV